MLQEGCSTLPSVNLHINEGALLKKNELAEDMFQWAQTKSELKLRQIRHFRLFVRNTIAFFKEFSLNNTCTILKPAGRFTSLEPGKSFTPSSRAAHFVAKVNQKPTGFLVWNSHDTFTVDLFARKAAHILIDQGPVIISYWVTIRQIFTDKATRAYIWMSHYGRSCIDRIDFACTEKQRNVVNQVQNSHSLLRRQRAWKESLNNIQFHVRVILWYELQNVRWESLKLRKTSWVCPWLFLTYTPTWVPGLQTYLHSSSHLQVFLHIQRLIKNFAFKLLYQRCHHQMHEKRFCFADVNILMLWYQ